MRRAGAVNRARVVTALAVALMLGGAMQSTARAEGELRGVRAWRPRIDIEPAAWFLHGYSVHVGVQPPAFPRVLLSTGAYAFDMPGMLMTMTGEDPQMWDGRLTFGAGAFADVFVGEHVDRGWVLGGQLGFQRYEVVDRMSGGRQAFDCALVLLRGGYEWHPRGIGGYVFPWAGVAITPEVGGDSGTYDPRPLVPYVTLDLGWRF